MLFLVKATIPIEAGNALVQDPQFSKRIQALVGEIKPKAVYFSVECGQRAVYLIVNMKDMSQLPAIAEPLWLSLNASVKFTPLMDQADMAKATPAIQQAVKKFS